VNPPLDGRSPLGRTEPGVTQCSALSKRTGKRCLRQASPGRKTCHYHGGKSLVGVANPNFKTGIYSALPEAIHAHYLKVKADPNFLSVAEELQVLRALAAELAGGLGVDVIAVRRDVGSAWDGFKAAQAGRNPDRMKEALTRLEHAIAEARDATAKINELIAAFDGIRKLSDAETKRLVLAKEMVTKEQAQLFSRLVQQAVKEAVDALEDPDDRRRVLGAFTDAMIRIQAGGLR